MEFRTQVKLGKSEFLLSHQHKVLLMGSCFAQEVGQRLQNDKFNCLLNPFGILYNPASICKSLERIVAGTLFTENDLQKQGEMFFSWMHHSDFSATTEKETLQLMNTSLQEANAMLHELDVLVLTFGTNRCYKWKKSGEIVGNCHKVPESQFEVVDLSINEMVGMLTETLGKLWEINPKLQVIFTVSPIRYAKYGFHGSQLSKASLLLLCHEVANVSSGRAQYFPAYEIMMDELRDYRFYATDMVHPSSLAVDYIYERFGEWCFGEDTISLMQQYRPIHRALQHRPKNDKGEEYAAFLRQTLSKIEKLKKEYPFLPLEKEIEICNIRLSR